MQICECGKRASTWELATYGSCVSCWSARVPVKKKACTCDKITPEELAAYGRCEVCWANAQPYAPCLAELRVGPVARDTGELLEVA